MTQLVFVDTEFTNFEKPDLISIACVPSEDWHVYVENLDFDRASATDWVQENIYPLLDPKQFGMSRDNLVRGLWDWFNEFETPVIVMVDYHRDRELLLKLFNFEPHPKIKDICNIYHSFAQSLNGLEFSKLEDRFDDAFKEFFKVNRTHTQHHALSDALATKHAFLTVVKEFNLKESDYV